MINFIRKQKGTILPVTIVSMFIMMVVAFTCIKMFLVQNIMSTTDQLKVRAFYAAEGAMERQKSRIYRYIRDINNNNNIRIGEDTAINGNRIENLVTTGSLSNFKDFSDGNFSGVYDDVQFVTEDQMHPNINVSTSISPFSFESWLIDCGIDFYAKKGINKTAATLYGNFIDLSPAVYDNPTEFENIDNGYAKKETWFALINTTGKNVNTFSPKNTDISERFESVVSNAKINAIKAQMEQAYQSGPNQISFCIYKVDYVVENFRQGYKIESSANAQISHKIPTVTCNMRLYFDIFLTKLYRRYNVNRCFVGTKLLNVWIWLETIPSSTKYEFVDSKYVNNVKFHIQKWEVLN